MPRSDRRETLKRKHLLKSLDYITNNSDFASLPADTNKFLRSAFYKLKATTNSDWNIVIPQTEIPIIDKKLSGHNPTLLIGGKIKGIGDEIKFSSFSVCVVFKTHSQEDESLPSANETSSLNIPSCCLTHHRSKKRIVRRFHFDIQSESQGKPISHFQYGGKFPEEDKFKDYHYCLEHFLENPRIHYFPMDFVLLLDMILNEFSTPLDKLTEESNWRGLVFKSQELWWKTYCNELAGYVNNPQGKTYHETLYS
ncbi:MAG: hypothetical protein ACFFCW_09325 [Candidatus Hodarchaeota archaeon]